MGTGPPLVFIHGLAGCWQNWLENIPYFARSHRVIAVDLAGFGESELPQEDISIPGYGRFMDAFLGEIGVERASLVGNSMGGFIAAETAISHPSRVEKLVLVSAAGGARAADGTIAARTRVLRGARCSSSRRSPWRGASTSCAARGCAAGMLYSGRAIPTASARSSCTRSPAAPASPASSTRSKRSSTTTSATACRTSPARR